MSRRRLIRSSILVALALLPGTAGAGGGTPPGQLLPQSLTPPSISGVAQLGNTLTADPGSWSGKSLSFAYQWQRCDTAGANCAADVGARSAAYAPLAADVGYSLRVVVTATNKNGSAAATSAATSVIAPPPTTTPSSTPPSSSSPPTITGIAQAGQTLSAAAGSWSGTSPMTYTYQWQRCATSCGPISGASASTYVLVQADVGASIRVAVTASNAAGSASANSSTTAIVAAATSTTSAPASGAYFTDGFDAASYCKWLTIFDYLWNQTSWAACSYPALDATRRIHVASDPTTGSKLVTRFEIRDSDSAWPGTTNLQKEEIRTDSTKTWNGSFAWGKVIWVGFDLYLPSPGFNWRAGGTNPFLNLYGLHGASGTNPGCNYLGVQILSTSYANNWLQLNLRGGTTPAWGPGGTSNFEAVNVLQLTDTSGNRVSSTFNRWHRIVIGTKAAYDGTIGSSSGWVKVYLDGTEIYGKSRPTFWQAETGPYLKLGLYKQKDNLVPTGATSAFFQSVRVGATKADVDS